MVATHEELCAACGLNAKWRIQVRRCAAVAVPAGDVPGHRLQSDPCRRPEISLAPPRPAADLLNPGHYVYFEGWNVTQRELFHSLGNRTFAAEYLYWIAVPWHWLGEASAVVLVLSSGSDLDDVPHLAAVRQCRSAGAGRPGDHAGGSWATRSYRAENELGRPIGTFSRGSVRSCDAIYGCKTCGRSTRPSSTWHGRGANR